MAYSRASEQTQNIKCLTFANERDWLPDKSSLTSVTNILAARRIDYVIEITNQYNRPYTEEPIELNLLHSGL